MTVTVNLLGDELLTVGPDRVREIVWSSGIGGIDPAELMRLVRDAAR